MIGRRTPRAYAPFWQPVAPLDAPHLMAVSKQQAAEMREYEGFVAGAMTRLTDHLTALETRLGQLDARIEQLERLVAK